MNTQLSKHFSESEFLHSDTANRLGINNEWESSIHKENAIILCERYLERIREYIGRPVIITSGYRSRALNGALKGSSSNSSHMTGQAADLWVNGLSRDELVQKINELCQKRLIPGIEYSNEYRTGYDQLVTSHSNNYVHFGINLNNIHRLQYLHYERDGSISKQYILKLDSLSPSNEWIQEQKKIKQRILELENQIIRLGNQIQDHFKYHRINNIPEIES